MRLTIEWYCVVAAHVFVDCVYVDHDCDDVGGVVVCEAAQKHESRCENNKNRRCLLRGSFVKVG